MVDDEEHMSSGMSLVLDERWRVELLDEAVVLDGRALPLLLLLPLDAAVLLLLLVLRL